MAIGKTHLLQVFKEEGFKVQGGKVAKSDAAAAKKLVDLIIKVEKILAKYDNLRPIDDLRLSVKLKKPQPHWAGPHWDIFFVPDRPEDFVCELDNPIFTADVQVYGDLVVGMHDHPTDRISRCTANELGELKEFMEKFFKRGPKDISRARKRAEKPKTAKTGNEDKLIEVICDSWTLPAKKDVTTPKGVLKCWFTEHGDDQGYKRKASIDGKVYSEDPHEGWKAGDDKISFIEKYWVDPSKKMVKTSEGTLKCWVEEHPEGADRGGYLGKAEIDGKVFTEYPVDGWELG